MLFKNPVNFSKLIFCTSICNGDSFSPEPVIAETTFVSIILVTKSTTLFSYSSIFIVKVSILLLPSLVFAVIVTCPFAFAVTLTLFPVTSIDAMLSSFTDHSTSCISASAFTIAVNTLLLPTYKLLILLFIVILCANELPFLTITVIVLTADAPLLSVTLYVTSYVPASFIFTVFFIIFASVNTIFPSSSSSAVTPDNGLNSSPTCNTLSSAFIVGTLFNCSILGFTVTVIVLTADAPLLSVTLYVTSYVPTSFIFTVFFIIFASVNTIFPSSSSSAVTPANGLNSSPTCNTLSSAFIVGTLFNCSILGFTVTVIVLTADAPLLSVILYVTSYVPASFIFTVFFIIFASVNTIFPSSSSSAVTPANGLNSSPTCNTLSSAFIVGA